MPKKNEEVSYAYNSNMRKYVTTDGIAYETMEQACAHCNEVNNQQKIEK